MQILPADGSNGDGNVVPALILDSRYRAASKFLHSKDPTGGLLSTVLFMDSVEDWVVSRLELDEQQGEQVRVRLRRLSEILTQHRENIPPDNYALLQLLSWMKSSESFYTLDYLTQFQPEFTVQFIGYCQQNQGDEVNANLALQRIMVLYRTRLLDRVYSPENFDYVMSVIMEMAQ